MIRDYSYVLDSLTNEVHYLNLKSGVYLCGKKPQTLDLDISWANASKLVHCSQCNANIPGKIILLGKVMKVYDSLEEANADFGDTDE